MRDLSVNELEPATLLEATGLSVGYGAGAVVRNIDVTLRRGEVVALLGPNGAGKSTTLLALAGELRPMEGSIVWHGAPGWKPLHKRAREGLAFILEDRSVFSRLTVAQNVAVCRQRAASDQDVTALFPELGPLAHRRGGLLSGGEQRMLAVARALRSGSRVMLADELSLGLAPKTVERLLRAIRAAADDGLGALVVEQHVHRVLEIADRVYVLQGGRVRFAGTATAAREQLDHIRDQYLSSSANVVEPDSQRLRTLRARG